MHRVCHLGQVDHLEGLARGGDELAGVRDRLVRQGAHQRVLREERRNANAYLEEKNNPRKRRRPTRAVGTTRSQGDDVVLRPNLEADVLSLLPDADEELVRGRMP